MWLLIKLGMGHPIVAKSAAGGPACTGRAAVTGPANYALFCTLTPNMPGHKTGTIYYSVVSSRSKKPVQVIKEPVPIVIVVRSIVRVIRPVVVIVGRIIGNAVVTGRIVTNRIGFGFISGSEVRFTEKILRGI
jgi:hypothetical protein